MLLQSILEFDLATLSLLDACRGNAFLDGLMILASRLGDLGLVWIMMAVGLLLDKRTRTAGMLTLASMALATMLGEGLIKHLVQRPRPFDEYLWIQPLAERSTPFSFPSGHAAASFAAALVLAKHIRKYASAFWALAGAIAISRIYLSMHYPSDVAAGIALGLLCGLAVFHGYRRLYGPQ